MSDATSTVLVIDDDPDLRTSVGRLLRSLGISFQLFASISEFLKSEPPVRDGRDGHVPSRG